MTGVGYQQMRSVRPLGSAEERYSHLLTIGCHAPQICWPWICYSQFKQRKL